VRAASLRRVAVGVQGRAEGGAVRLDADTRRVFERANAQVVVLPMIEDIEALDALE